MPFTSSFLVDNVIHSIVLPEDITCPCEKTQSQCQCQVRTCGDEVCGSLEVHLPCNPGFDVEIRLEGICKTQQGQSNNSYAQTTPKPIKFLEQVDCKSIQPLDLNEPLAPVKRLISFKHKIPTQLLPDGSTQDPRLLKLYPSIKLASYVKLTPSLISNTWEQQKMEVSISYSIVAIIKLTEACSLLSNSTFKAERSIKVIPTNLPDPPRNIAFYPDEFTLKGCRQIKRRLITSKLGTLQVSVDEPKPLNLAVKTPQTSTEIPILLSFITSKQSINPNDFTMVVKSQLRIRSFYSKTKFEQEPSIKDALKSNVYMKSEMTKVKESCYKDVVWIQDHTGYNKTTTADKSLSLFWISIINTQIALSKHLPPSFFCPLATIRYSVNLKISILGCYQSTISVEVPVQLFKNLPTKSNLNSTGLDVSENDNTSAIDLDNLDEHHLGDTDENLDQPPVYRR